MDQLGGGVVEVAERWPGEPKTLPNAQAQEPPQCSLQPARKQRAVALNSPELQRPEQLLSGRGRANGPKTPSLTRRPRRSEERQGRDARAATSKRPERQRREQKSSGLDQTSEPKNPNLTRGPQMLR